MYFENKLNYIVYLIHNLGIIDFEKTRIGHLSKDEVFLSVILCNSIKSLWYNNLQLPNKKRRLNPLLDLRPLFITSDYNNNLNISSYIIIICVINILN